MKHLRRLWPYVRLHRRRYALGLALVALGTLASAAAPALIKFAIDALQNGATQRFLTLAALAIVLLALVRGVVHFAGRTLILTTARRIEYDVRNDLYRHLMRLPPSFYDRRASGDITSRAINDLDGVRMMVGFALMSLVGTSLMFASCLTGMFAIDGKLTLLCLAPLSLVTLITAASGAAMHAKSLAVQDQLGTLSARAQENFTGARVVRAFAQEEHEIERYRRECDEYLRRNMSLVRLRATIYATITFFTQLAVVATLWMGGRGLIRGSFSAGDFAAFTAYQFMLVWPMVGLGWTITMVQRGVACLGRITELLEAPPEQRDGSASGTDFAGRIDVRNLTFRYDEDREPALRNVSFAIEPGETVAIVGRTGSGKSSIAALLTRLYPAPAGTIFVDGKDVNDIPVEELRKAVGCVPQDPFLFSDTLRENIAFGSLDGQAGVERAAALARIAADAERFPGRLDQMIGERGVTLSGGQKQRTALARALVRRPAILILDDALSSVDAHTEREILDELRSYRKGRTCIVITHRLAAVRDADRIVVLGAGEVAETGRHDELVARGGLYARMCERQQIVDQLEGP
ncbi:MAG: ABC transporter ATP-binding protein [Planctomycetes bacterium]|nr:ABC transporter ATP-binding protein [Planctomycetota bacterium]